MISISGGPGGDPRRRRCAAGRQVPQAGFRQCAAFADGLRRPVRLAAFRECPRSIPGDGLGIACLLAHAPKGRQRPRKRRWRRRPAVPKENLESLCGVGRCASRWAWGWCGWWRAAEFPAAEEDRRHPPPVGHRTRYLLPPVRGYRQPLLALPGVRSFCSRGQVSRFDMPQAASWPYIRPATTRWTACHQGAGLRHPAV